MSGIIDGKRWLQERLMHLQAHLDTDLTEEERRAVEAELAAVKAELAQSRRHFRRWIIFGGRSTDV